MPKKKRFLLVKGFRKLNRIQIVLLLLLAAGAGYLIYSSHAKSFPTQNWGVWQPRIKACESGGTVYGQSNYSDYNPENTTSGHASGAYSITSGTWKANGGTAYASEARYASVAQQDAIALKLFNAYGGNDTNTWAASYHCWSNGGQIVKAPALPACALADQNCAVVAAGPPGTTYCATGETGHCSFGGYRDVVYGSSGKYRYRAAVYNGIPCSAGWFSGGDPNPGHRNYCYTYPGPSSGYKVCAGEGGFCSFTGTANIAFGANGHFNYRTNIHSQYAISSNGVNCNNSSFGPDPAVYYHKACYVHVTSSSGGSGDVTTGISTGGGGTGGTSSGPTQASYPCSSHPTVGYNYTTSGTCVKRVQYILAKTALYEGTWSEYPGPSSSSLSQVTDGAFGSNTYNSLKYFQGHHYQAGTSIKLTADGVAGQYTWGALEGQCGYMNSHTRNNVKC